MDTGKDEQKSKGYGRAINKNKRNHKISPSILSVCYLFYSFLKIIEKNNGVRGINYNVSALTFPQAVELKMDRRCR